MSQAEREKLEATAMLKEFIKPGDTIYTTLKHCSKSGMMRVIDLFVMEDNEPRRITSLACRAIQASYNDRHEGMKMDGCGMDMGFAAVYELGRVLFPDGFGDEGDFPNGSKGRPSTPEMAEKAITIGATFHGRNGDTSGWDNDGGYALKHRWL